MIRQAHRNVQQFILSGRFVQGHARLQQVARAVQFMAFQQVFPFVFGLFHREIGVQIAVRLLAAANQRHRFVHPAG